MNTDPTYEELAEFIARYVHAYLYLPEENHPDSTWNVDHMFSSTYEIPTGVLICLDILAPMNKGDPRSQFTCSPDEFADVIARNKEKGCSYAMLMNAIICLGWHEEITKPQEPTGLRDYGIKIGLFEPVEAPVIKLTPKGEAYEALDEDWPWLVDE